MSFRETSLSLFLPQVRVTRLRLSRCMMDNPHLDTCIQDSWVLGRMHARYLLGGLSHH